MSQQWVVSDFYLQWSYFIKPHRMNRSYLDGTSRGQETGTEWLSEQETIQLREIKAVREVSGGHGKG